MIRKLTHLLQHRSGDCIGVMATMQMQQHGEPGRTLHQGSMGGRARALKVTTALVPSGVPLLALPAVAAVALAQASARRGEVVVLRAVGVGRALQARTRRAELLGLELAKVVAGALAGYGVAALVMTDLVRATSPYTSQAVPFGLTAHWVGGIGLLLVITATVLVVASWYGRRVRRQVLETTWRGEIR